MTKTATPQQDFSNFPPVPEGHTRVFLNRSFGVGRGRLYGPGWSHVPDTLLPTIEAQPDLVRTDIAGVALVDSTAASVNGPRAASEGLPAIPHPARETDDDNEDSSLAETDGGPTDSLTAHRTAIEEAAAGERTGGQTIGETGSHLDTSRTLNPQPGQFATDPAHTRALAAEASTRERTAGGKADAGTTSGDEAKPATMTALRKVGVDDLREIAKQKNVKLKDDDDKETIVAKLYDARVSLDD